MQHAEFVVGKTFWCNGKRRRCTDIGTRVIVALLLDHDDDPSWYDGLPTALQEHVFDEYDIEGCTLTPEE